jgi:predicted nucleic acid-binding protein
MAADPIFLDTSLLVAASVGQHPGHLAAKSYLGMLARSQSPTCISPQVCREFMVVLTRQPVSGRTFTLTEAIAALDAWRSLCTLLQEDEHVVREWRRLVEHFQVRGKQLHDCNLVAVMRTHGVQRLATRNAADFQRYASLITVESITP